IVTSTLSSVILFFFSSRRRHTRCLSDWSSDVCSSDLSIHEGLAAKIILQEYPGQEFDGKVTRTAGALDPQSRTMQVEVQAPNDEIGRASCRERVQISVEV